MAVTVKLYNHAAALLASLDLGNLRFMLLNDDASFDATHTTLAGPAGAANVNEVEGNGWTTGGEFLANVAWAQVSTNDSILDCDDIDVIADGGVIGPAYAAVIYDDSHPNKAPIQFIDFGEAVSAGDTTQFKYVFPPNGVVRLDYTLP